MSKTKVSIEDLNVAREKLLRVYGSDHERCGLVAAWLNDEIKKRRQDGARRSAEAQHVAKINEELKGEIDANEWRARHD